MRFLYMLLTVALLPLLAASVTVEVDGDGTLRVDNERRFVIGMYETPKTDAAATELKEAGFNLVQFPANQEGLDMAAKNGLGAWVNVGGRMQVRDAASGEKLKTFVKSLSGHPALWVWEVPDEALWNLYFPKLQAVKKRWNALRRQISDAQIPEPLRAALEDIHERLMTYNNSARFLKAEAEERKIRKALGLPVECTPLLSQWHEGVEPLRTAMSEGCRVTRRADGKHPIWFNHAPRNTIADLRLFGEIADLAGCDIYPVPFGRYVGHSDLADRHRSSVGAYTRRMAAGAPGKAIWMVLQGFSWNDISTDADPKPKKPRPTYDQSRFMAYDAIANGARGILYWGTYKVEKDSRLWGALKKVAGDLSELEPLLAAPDPGWPIHIQLDATPQSADREIACVVRRLGSRTLIVLANENSAPLGFTIHGLDKIEGTTFQVRDSWEEISVRNGELRFGLTDLECAVLISE